MFMLKIFPKYILFVIFSAGNNSYDNPYSGTTAVFDDLPACIGAGRRAMSSEGVLEAFCVPQSSEVQIPFKPESPQWDSQPSLWGDSK
jgi:hypothetical protein